MKYQHLLLTFFAVLLPWGCPPPPVPSNVDVLSERVYAQGYVSETPFSPGGGRQYELVDLLMDVYVPTDAPGVAKPAVLMVHGGAFVAGSREMNDLRTYAVQIASAGYVCFLIDYRLDSDAPPAPDAWGNSSFTAAIHAAAVDAKAALRHIFAYAEAYEVDTERVALMGASAGAITAINAGMSDPEDFANDGPGYVVPGGNLAGQPTSVVCIVDLWGSAAFALEEMDSADPPVLVVHGTLDTTPTVTYADALVLKKSLEDHGIPFEFCPLKGKGHAAWDAEVDGRDLAEITLDFLAYYMPSAG